MRKPEAHFSALVATIILLIALVPVAAWAAPARGDGVQALSGVLVPGDILRAVTLRSQTGEVHLDLAGGQSADAVSDLRRLEVEAFILGKKALDKWPRISVARVRVYYQQRGGRSDPAMDLVVARYPGQGGKYRSMGYARPLHLSGGWGGEPVLVRYRHDIFDLFRQEMVDVQQLGWSK